MHHDDVLAILEPDLTLQTFSPGMCSMLYDTTAACGWNISFVTTIAASGVYRIQINAANHNTISNVTVVQRIQKRLTELSPTTYSA